LWGIAPPARPTILAAAISDPRAMMHPCFTNLRQRHVAEEHQREDWQWRREDGMALAPRALNMFLKLDVFFHNAHGL